MGVEATKGVFDVSAAINDIPVLGQSRELECTGRLGV